jgi:hypothetical protein
MPQDWTNLIGGFAQGFGNAKNQAKDRALNEEYKKIAMENVKATAKLHEAQIKKLDMEGGLLKWAMGDAQSGLAGQTPQGNLPQQPVAPGPVSQAPAQTPLPNQMAAMQYPNPLGEGQGGGLSMDPSGQQSYRNNNIWNTEYRDWQKAYGGERAPEGRFTKYPSLQASVAATADLLNKSYSNETIASGIEKFAPTWQNPTTPQRIKETAAALGVSPNTKIGDLPLGPFMTLQAKYESPTKIDPAVFGEAYNIPIKQAGGIIQAGQQEQPKQAPSLNQFQSNQRGILTPKKFLEGYMKKNYGVEPDEVKVDSYGDHKLVTDKKSGQPLFMIAGQGKTEMVDTTLPDGSVIKRPVVIPPSPLPGGIPVINLAGQPAPGTSLGGPMQTKPPGYVYEEVGAPGGGKQKVVAPIAQPGAPAIQTEPSGVKMADLGKTNQILQAEARLDEVNKMIYPNGKVDRGLLLKAWAPQGGVGEGRKLYSKMYQIIDAALRIETGAQATPGEIEVKMQEFFPNGLKDTESVIREKSKDLNQYFMRLRKLQDPTGDIGKMGGVNIQVPKSITPNQKPKTWEELKRQIGGQ